MAWYDDADQIRRDIAELRVHLDAQPGLSADSRAAALSAIVSAGSLVLAVETFQSNKDGVLYDIVGPLTVALKGFREPAEELASALRRLPEH